MPQWKPASQLAQGRLGVDAANIRGWLKVIGEDGIEPAHGGDAPLGALRLAALLGEGIVGKVGYNDAGDI